MYLKLFSNNIVISYLLIVLEIDYIKALYQKKIVFLKT